MVTSCCAVGCTNRKTRNSKLHFYTIPKRKTPFEQRRRQLWLEAISRDNWPEQQVNKAFLCSAHFISGKRSDDPENLDFVPSIFNFTSSQPYSRKHGRKVGKVSKLKDSVSTVPPSTLSTASSTSTREQNENFTGGKSRHQQPELAGCDHLDSACRLSQTIAVSLTNTSSEPSASGCNQKSSKISNKQKLTTRLSSTFPLPLDLRTNFPGKQAVIESLKTAESIDEPLDFSAASYSAETTHRANSAFEFNSGQAIQGCHDYLNLINAARLKHRMTQMVGHLPTPDKSIISTDFQDPNAQYRQPRRDYDGAMDMTSKHRNRLPQYHTCTSQLSEVLTPVKVSCKGKNG
ncbi:THAP domain-containing protein 5-like [Acanthaster planci]|uniref:THAP domain-containing protein 5-like n=1 Tax=Acanthaster planci TaxID=133434 RepID=A0A8B7ZBX6_ACAPL|nr:THAP domain-containing protein 5-like [Acanthaster planci]